MAKRQASEGIRDGSVYTVADLAGIVGRSKKVVRQFIREQVQYGEPFTGVLLVRGRHFRLAIEAMSGHDTPEATAKAG